MAILLLVSATGRAEKSTTDADIDFLLDNVVSSDCVFTRNGRFSSKFSRAAPPGSSSITQAPSKPSWPCRCWFSS